MRRRTLLKHAGALPIGATLPAGEEARAAAEPFRRVRPSDPAWPSPSAWQSLNDATGGSLFRVESPLAACESAPASTACEAVFRALKNPYATGDTPALTQTTGWADAWISEPSAYAVKVRNTADVVAAVNFAREHRLRLVVKGGGHSYQGTSNAADSLLIWTRALDAIALHDAFVGVGCSQAPQTAVSVGSGNIWFHVYDAVMTRAGRYVQGGGCATVGVAGLVQGGGFGSFSKRFGIAGASLLEAEIVTADGAVRIANDCTEPDLFWALKGGGGGTFGVVTRLTLRTHALPDTLGGAFGVVAAPSDDAFRRLLERFVGFYADALFNPSWGETVAVGSGNRLGVSMVFQGMDQAAAERVWAPFLDWVHAAPGDFTITEPFRIFGLPGRRFWDASWLRANVPGLVISDDRPGAPEGDVFWAGNLGEAGWFIHAYDSRWLPASLLRPDGRTRLADALFAASRQWRVGLHTNKGLAGAPPEAIEAAGRTPMNPAVQEAFALAIIASGGPPARPGIAGHEPDLARARAEATRIGAAMTEMQKVADGGSYVSETNYFNPAWRESYWGPNYPRLRAVKDRYDPGGLFFVHHGVGSEDWSADGFTRVA
ncbi:MAG TPA: FAD-binding oxidoreductase [Acetobacteraceae bacterium]|nr:FAD-binding oxidoreductase [Acetobacteraceae bacterium]